MRLDGPKCCFWPFQMKSVVVRGVRQICRTSAQREVRGVDRSGRAALNGVFESVHRIKTEAAMSLPLHDLLVGERL